MGWRLAQEVLDHCPDIKYRQFRVLMSFAFDARDETRQGMPGMEKLTLQANCKMRQTLQAMADLRNLGIIKTVTRSAPGRRAVYELSPMCTNNGCGHSRMRTGAEKASTHADSGVTHAESEATHADMPASSKSLLSSQSPKSSLSARVRELLTAVDSEVSERETDLIIRNIKNNGGNDVVAVVRGKIARGDAGALIDEARQVVSYPSAESGNGQHPAAGLAGRFDSVASLQAARDRECEHGTPNGSTANCALCRVAIATPEPPY